MVCTHLLRYAFSPLIDGGEEEELAEPMLGAGATETMKMRGLKNSTDNASKLNRAVSVIIYFCIMNNARFFKNETAGMKIAQFGVCQSQNNNGALGSILQL